MRPYILLGGLICIAAAFSPSTTAYAAPVSGDVDSSGSVDAVDVQLVINAALGITVAGHPDIDLDEEHATNAVDVQLVINAALGIDIDADDDGLADPAEENLGTTLDNPDTDGDGVGDGDEIAGGTDPLVPDAVILIDSIEELQLIGNDPAYPLNGSYELTQDIDAGVTATWKGNLGFSPIGTSDNPFTGAFDGKSFTISNLTINRPLQDFVGLFGQAGTSSPGNDGATIQNVNLGGGSVAGHDNTGALCGKFALGEVIDCHASSTVTANQFAGGLLGVAGSNVTVSSCTAAATVISISPGNVDKPSDALGGLVGWSDGTILNCSSTSQVTASLNGTAAGGLAGQNNGSILNSTSSGTITTVATAVGGLAGINFGQIADCQSSSNVTGRSDVGGLVGENLLSLKGVLISITRSRATGNVTAEGRAGGLAGLNGDSTITECIAEGNVVVNGIGSNGSNAGGLVGFNRSNAAHPISDCFALGDVSGQFDIGGLVGIEQNDGGSTSDPSVYGPIVRCYAAGQITATNQFGGLVGLVLGEASLVLATDSFWDTQTTGQASSPGGGTGKNTIEMMTKSTFTDAGWDFDGIWEVTDGSSYPSFRWFLNLK